LATTGKHVTDAFRYGRAFAAASLLALVTFAWMVTAGNFDFGRRIPFGGDFYDAQAHSLLAGHWEMPASVLRLEGFRHAGHLYMYFGPAPALLRLPTAAFTHSLDGRTGRVAMLLAFTVAMVALGRLGWRIRRLARGDAPLERREELIAGVSALVLAVGSSLLFLGSGPFVYHEALMWGVAFSLAAFDALLAWIEQPNGRVLAVASLLTLLALTSRFAVGIGPAAVLGFLLLGAGVARLRRGSAAFARLGLDLRDVRWRTVAGIGVALLIPLGVYAIVNMIKFGTLFSVPYDTQVASSILAERPATLAANNGSLFNVKAMATNLLAYTRPDSISFDSSFPWIALPTTRPTVLGNLRYDMLDFTPSVVATMPALFALAVGGLVAIVRAPVRAATATLRSLSLPILGAACGVVPTLVIVYITPRYLADFVPLLVLPAFAGLHALVAWSTTDAGRRPVTKLVVAALLVLGVWSCLANVGIAREYQRQHDASFFARGTNR